MQIEWKENSVPASMLFDDPYYSLDDGVAETQHVFLDGNDLPRRFRPGFHIAELGFGTGLNLLVTLAAWRGAGVDGVLRYTSFEQYPLGADDMAQAHRAFPALRSVADELAPHWGKPQFAVQGLEFTLITGDARTTLPAQNWQVDAWYLDGFSPAKNPELWGADLMMAVGAHTALGGSFATYTAAGHVRRGLVAAGFEIAKTPGFGRKRHMTRGVKP